MTPAPTWSRVALGRPGELPHVLPDGTPVAQMCGISTFAEVTTVDVRSTVKIDEDIPSTSRASPAAGSAPAGGSAVQSADVNPGDTVIVMGVGGIGINAVQGAAHAGASPVIAVDPVPFKREKAMELGATEAFGSIEEADEFARSVTSGQGADKAIVTIGITKGEHVAEAFKAIRKAGTVVVTGLGGVTEGAVISWSSPNSQRVGALSSSLPTTSSG